MRYEGDAVQYTAFALVAIESVWPNPEGNELSPDDADLSLINSQASPNKTDARLALGSSTDSSSESSGVITERDYHNKQGYYKILPLNVTQVRTSSSMGGSTFTATFTLDDLLLVTSSENESAFRYATGLPMSTNDLVESDLQGALPMLVDTGQEKASWRYVKDEELGLARYRISGNSSSFNVEDLVDVNDTVTIWIYHDPQDFYFKDELAEDGNNVFDESGNLLRFNEKINNVIGSGDRRNQFFTDKQSFDETLLGALGITNEFISTSIEELLVSGAEEEEVQGQVPSVNQGNIYDLINSFYISSTSGTLQLNVENKLRASVFASFPPETTSDTSRNRILDLMIYFSSPGSNQPGRDEQGRILETSLRPTEIRNARNDFRKAIQLLKLDNSGSGFLFLHSMEAYTPNEIFDITKLTNGIGIESSEELSELIFGLNLFAKEIDKKTENYVSRYLRRKNIARSRQTFVNGRTALVNESHGETPYLALKGSISSVEVGVGTSEGSYIVTVSGKGYEKVLQDNEIYYEDLLYPSNIYTPQTEYHTIYVNMSPPRAIQHIVSRWAAKQVILGKSNTWSQAAFNRYIFIEQLLTRTEEEDNEGNTKVKYEKIEGKSKELLGGGIPIRGNFVLSEFSLDPQESNVRLFAPINYLDTSRIQEMVRTLDRSYAAPDVEAAINTAVELDSRRSVMDNIRKVGGVANFYQMFVDEAGRLRYRLSFEAMERTPAPEYTPTIQDYDTLSEGNSFSMDDSQLVTMVDVKPIVGQHNVQFLDLGFIGRNVPEKGKVPLLELNTPEEMISPELYRYGLKTLKIEDIYQSETGGAKRKAALYRGFFGQPLKKATLRVRNNTSYRVGETVLVSLQKNKKRSRALIDIARWINWLSYLKSDQTLMEMYIGVDGRFLETGKNSFVLTSGTGYTFFDKKEFYDKFNENPHLYVLEQFLRTFIFLALDVLVGQYKMNVITPEYFPSLYWYYSQLPGGAYGWDENRIDDEVIVEAYKYAIQAALSGGKTDASDKLQNLLTHGEINYPGVSGEPRVGGLVGDERRNDYFKVGLINALRFQDFRLASYFIESVTHNFSYGSDATTSLSLNYGQDNLAILDPVHLMPFGFISLEKKMRIGYEGQTQEDMWQEYPSSKSALQNMYIEQFLEDRTYKKGSFLHASQFLRNSSNLMYEIATVREGLDSMVEWEINEDGERERALIERESATSIDTTRLVSTNKENDQDTQYSESTRRVIELLGLKLDNSTLARRAEESGRMEVYIENYAAGSGEITRDKFLDYIAEQEGFTR